MAEIELRNVVLKDGENTLLDGVSFKVEDGEYVGVLGPTGSGPSYILQVIAGLLPINSGTILFDGEDVTNKPPEDRHIGFIFEQFNLFPHLSVMDNLLFGPRMRRENIEEKTIVAREIISMVRLDGREDAISKELSGGMQQRVGIARAVTAGAKILLLDQPYRALDAKIREEMRFEIRDIVKELGLTAIHSTHETEEAMITSDRIAIFNNGRLEQLDTPENIFYNSSSKFVSTFLAESNVIPCSYADGTIQIQGTMLETADRPRDNNSKLEVVIRQNSVNLFLTKPTGKNIVKGTITKVRLLGEFIRFVVTTDSGWEIVSRQLLSLRWQNPNSFLEKKVFIHVDPRDLKLFPIK